MTKETTPSKSPNEIVSKKFVEAVDILIKKGIVKNASVFSDSISLRRTAISKMRSNIASVSVEALYKTIHKYNLNIAFFFNEDEDLFEQPKDAGKEKHDKMYEFIASNILNKAPDELKDDIQIMLHENRRANKLLEIKEEELNRLRENEINFSDMMKKVDKRLKELGKDFSQSQD